MKTIAEMTSIVSSTSDLFVDGGRLDLPSLHPSQSHTSQSNISENTACGITLRTSRTRVSDAKETRPQRRGQLKRSCSQPKN
eukprot:3763791-Rhodomonas_salina.1